MPPCPSAAPWRRHCCPAGRSTSGPCSHRSRVLVDRPGVSHCESMRGTNAEDMVERRAAAQLVSDGSACGLVPRGQSVGTGTGNNRCLSMPISTALKPTSHTSFPACVLLSYRWRMQSWSCATPKKQLWPPGGRAWSAWGAKEIQFSKIGTFYYACTLHCQSHSKWSATVEPERKACTRIGLPLR